MNTKTCRHWCINSFIYNCLNWKQTKCPSKGDGIHNGAPNNGILLNRKKIQLLMQQFGWLSTALYWSKEANLRSSQTVRSYLYKTSKWEVRSAIGGQICDCQEICQRGGVIAKGWHELVFLGWWNWWLHKLIHVLIHRTLQLPSLKKPNLLYDNFVWSYKNDHLNFVWIRIILDLYNYMRLKYQFIYVNKNALSETKLKKNGLQEEFSS